jgi:hypothetical protein
LSDNRNHPEATYLQSQNGNLYRFNALEAEVVPSEFSALHSDVPKEISWVSEALGNYNHTHYTRVLLIIPKDAHQTP